MEMGRTARRLRDQIPWTPLVPRAANPANYPNTPFVTTLFTMGIIFAR